MAQILSKIVPWGRSLDEYARMFALSPADLESRILDCGAGPSSFNAEVTARGGRVVSCDPIYEFSADEIRQRVHETCPMMIAGAETHREKFVWREFESPERLGKIRMAAMERFLADYPNGLREGRYRVGELPALPFRDAEFDLVLCSHFLSTYSDLLPLEFHVESVRELCRVAREARIFPLVQNFASERSPHLAPLIEELSAHGYRCEIVRVPYEFQRGGNEMLRVLPPQL
jgi:SAM-dependent methyltransferase